jgi:hypothetical protein
MYYITYQYFTVETNSKSASAGIESGSPALQAGTLSKELSTQYLTFQGIYSKRGGREGSNLM